MLLINFGLCVASATIAIPTVPIAGGGELPMISMGGINVTLEPSYPDGSNYTLWLSLGGRGFDTAWEYETQIAVAAAVAASGLARSEVFITSKIPGSLHGGCCGCPGAAAPPACLQKCHGVCFPAYGHYTAANATAYIALDLAELAVNGLEYIDLLLMHEPSDYLAPYAYNASFETGEIYGALEAAMTSEDPAFKGKIKAIGVSNFDHEMLALLAKTNPATTPAVNQCRMSVGGYDAETHAYCKQHGIVYQAYSVLHGDSSAPPVVAAAAAHGVSAQQVMERWATQLGVPIVTSSNVSAYDTEDIAIFDITLTAAEMSAITSYSPAPAPAGKCAANPTCSGAKGQCIVRGCQVCSTTPPAKSCGSCGCATCCAGCTLTVAKGLPYCAESTRTRRSTFPFHA